MSSGALSSNIRRWMAQTMAGRKIKSSRTNVLQRSAECLHHDTLSACGGTRCKRAGVRKPRCSVISRSRRAARNTSESAHPGNELASLRSLEALSSRLSDAIAVLWPLAVKNGIIMETGLLHKQGNFEKDAVEKEIGNAIRGEPSARIHETQHTTYSSCTDSSLVTVPFSSPNDGRWKTFEKASSSRKKCNASGFTSNLTVFNKKKGKPITSSAGSGISVQFARKATTNRGGRYLKRASSILQNVNSLVNANENLYRWLKLENGNISGQLEDDSHEKAHSLGLCTCGVGEAEVKTNIHKWISRFSSSSEEERANITSKSSICTGKSNNLDCSTKYEENAVSSSPMEGTINPGKYGDNNLFAVKSKSQETINNSFPGCESSYLLMKKPTQLAQKDHDSFVFGFDLNEDIDMYGVNGCTQLVVEDVSSHNVIRVAPRPVVSKALPVNPLKFEGGLGWKGSAATSAFNPPRLESSNKNTLLSYYSSQHPRGLTGIDLNVAASEYSQDTGASREQLRVYSTSLPEDICSEVDTERAKRLNIDLNNLSDDVDEYLPNESQNPASLDLNSSFVTSENCNDINFLGQDSTEN